MPNGISRNETGLDPFLGTEEFQLLPPTGCPRGGPIMTSPPKLHFTRFLKQKMCRPNAKDQKKRRGFHTAIEFELHRGGVPEMIEVQVTTKDFGGQQEKTTNDGDIFHNLLASSSKQDLITMVEMLRAEVKSLECEQKSLERRLENAKKTQG